jgi:hypothetical protein
MPYLVVRLSEQTLFELRCTAREAATDHGLQVSSYFSWLIDEPESWLDDIPDLNLQPYVLQLLSLEHGSVSE